MKGRRARKKEIGTLCKQIVTKGERIIEWINAVSVKSVEMAETMVKVESE